MLKLVFPAAVTVGPLMRVKYERIVEAFVRANNSLVMRRLKRRPSRILLLMPHCLQFSDCEYRVTGKEIRCRRCGKCEITDLMEISDRYHVRLSIASGGTMARNLIRSVNPDLIIATACERDLISGLKDTAVLPVIGILNERPNGPCNDTRVDLGKITALLNSLQGMKQ